MDLKNILKEDEDVGEQTPETSIRVHKKPMQLRDIENRSASRKVGGSTHESKETIKDLIDEEKINSYKKPWNKLDTGLKLNRLKDFIERQELDGAKGKQLEALLLNACKSNKLNKNSDIEYDTNIGEIKNIKILKIVNEKYVLNITEVKKSKSGGKSKSNIDRFLKGSSR